MDRSLTGAARAGTPEHWPYVILAAAKYGDHNGNLYGDGLYIEGDAETHWCRTRAACFEAIIAEVFDFWKLRQSNGPEDMPAIAGELPARYRCLYLSWSPGETS